MKISREEVEHVALLARLELDEEEKEQYTRQLNDILGYAELLQKLDISQIEPTAHAAGLNNVFREDVVGESMGRAEVLRNAPQQENGFFRVPRIV